MKKINSMRFGKPPERQFKNVPASKVADPSIIDLTSDQEICLAGEAVELGLREANRHVSRIAAARTRSRKLGKRSSTKLKRPPQKVIVGTMGVKGPQNPDHLDTKSLWACKTVEQVALHRLSGTRKFNTKCLQAIERRKLTEPAREMIAALLSGTATSSLALTNDALLERASTDVARKLYAMTKDNPDIEFVLITFIAGDGGTSLDRPFIELHHSRTQIQKVLRAICPNFIGVTEIAVLKSHTHPDGGRQVQRHEHVIMIGPNITERAREVAASKMGDFAPNVTGAEQINVRTMRGTELNLARVCAYLFKAPYKSMNWCPPRDGKPGFMNGTEAGERYATYLRMAQIRSMLTLEDTLFAGGACKAIKSDLIKLLRQMSVANVPVENRLLHPDEIGSFWVEVNKELRRPEWRLPVIARTA